MSNTISKTDYAVKPSETIAETIASLGMTKKEFSRRLDTTEQTLMRLLSAKQPITVDTASKLELVTGVKATFWLRLEAQYRTDCERIRLIREVEENREWLKAMPRGELRKRGLLAKATDGEEYAGVLEFFGVASVSAWEDIWNRPELAARKSNCFDTEFHALAAWVRMGERIAQELACEPYNAKAFKLALETIKKIACKPFSEQLLLEAQAVCAKCGVALVFVKNLAKAPFNGAARWLSSDKAMIVLSLRGRSEDKIWFSFFHEASHILENGKKLLFISDDDSDSPEEQQADRFAAEFLIPKAYDQEISGYTTLAQFSRLVKKLGIPSGIVMGRYAHITKNWSRFQKRIPSFSWPEGVWCLS